MYKSNNKFRVILSVLKSIGYWLKRKVMVLITAFMIGISNGIYDEDVMIDTNQNKIEQKEKE